LGRFGVRSLRASQAKRVRSPRDSARGSARTQLGRGRASFSGLPHGGQPA